MVKNRRCILSILLVFMSWAGANAQYNSDGADPSSLKWRQIKSPNYTVIYPQEVDSLARLYMYLFEKSRDMVSKDMSITTPSMPIVLHPYNIHSNGVTAWAPRRLEIYTTPLAEPLFSQSWEQMLAVHEGRHVAQMTHFTKGAFKVFYALAGEQSIVIGGGLSASSSTFEGDAVVAETEYSNAGRGRSADFLKHYRASFVEGPNLIYEQWKFGSYHKYTPSKYAYGYLLNTMVRTNKDYYASGRLYEAQRKNWWHIFSNSERSYKATDGYNVRGNWNMVAARFGDLFKAEDQIRRPFSPYTVLDHGRDAHYMSYTNIIPGDDGSVLATRSGMARSRELVKIDSIGRVRHLREFSSSTSALTEDGKGNVVFSEIVSDPRWEHRSYSILRRYNISTGRIENISSRTRYFNPAFSSDGSKLYAVEYKVKGGSCVVEVDQNNGQELSRIDAPQGGQIVNIAPIGEAIYASVVIGPGLGIMRHDSQGWSYVVEPQTRSIRDLRACSDTELSFASDVEGVDNIYIYNISNGNLERLVNSRFGAKHAYIDSLRREIYYSDYHVDGYQPVKASLDSLKRVEASFEKPYTNFFAEILSKQAEENYTPISPEQDSALYDKVQNMESTPYRKALNLLRIHSWAPIYANVDRIMSFTYQEIYQLAALGLTFISQNTLGTAVTTGGYSYHKGYHAGHLNFNYSGWYPVIELMTDINDHAHTQTVIGADGSREIMPLKSPSWDVYARLYLPLKFDRSGWEQGIVPRVQYDFSNDILLRDGRKQYKHDVTFSLNAYRIQRKPDSRLTPRFGIGAEASARVAFVPGSLAPEGLYYGQLYGYLPGITDIQGLKLSYTFQKQTTDYYRGYMENIAKVPRGYDKRPLYNYQKLSVDYAIPIARIDSLRGWLCYIKRLRIIPFADMALERSPYAEVPEKMMSYGTDFLVDGHLFRIAIKLSVGFRYAHTIEGGNYMGIIFSSSL